MQYERRYCILLHLLDRPRGREQPSVATSRGDLPSPDAVCNRDFDTDSEDDGVIERAVDEAFD